MVRSDRSRTKWGHNARRAGQSEGASLGTLQLGLELVMPALAEAIRGVQRREFEHHMPFQSVQYVSGARMRDLSKSGEDNAA